MRKTQRQLESPEKQNAAQLTVKEKETPSSYCSILMESMNASHSINLFTNSKLFHTRIKPNNPHNCYIRSDEGRVSSH